MPVFQRPSRHLLTTYFWIVLVASSWSNHLPVALGYLANNNNKGRPSSTPPPPPKQPQFQIVERVERGANNDTTGTTFLFKAMPTRNAPTTTTVRGPAATSNTSRNNSTAINTNKSSTTASPTINSSSSRWIGTDQLNHLKETVNIIDVVDAYNLDQFERKSNNRATAVCPFHDDHNPSLSIDSNRGMYKCFACGEGGDVFRFVRQMASLQDGQELSFYDSVRRVQDEFGDGTFVQGLSSSSSLSNNRAGSATLTKEERQQQERLQQRIYQINAAAAAFYSDTLTAPLAGGARAHLRDRFIPPTTSRIFALGYAPDMYFGPTAATTSSWGTGSLVEHLRNLGFLAKELVAAGLVTQTKRATEKRAKSPVRKESNEVQSTTADSADPMDHAVENEVSYDVLMDRFRGRIVVPIFDSTGKKILGFGGRILQETPDDAEFQQPKYLNSPESLVFQKKNVLFGLHLAKEVGESDTNDVIMVEGYMDAIALHSVGVNGVVASMGTAVSPEQLLAAAQAARRRDGSLILCLDSDDAGVSAVERLCLNGMVVDVLDKCSVDIRVASLPGGKKDPAEYVESRIKRGSKKEMVASDFISSTIKEAVPWIDWYIERILGSHSTEAKTGEDGSLRTIIDGLADFINICGNHIDRESKASEISASLADLIANSTNSTIVSDTVRNQLESDLLQLAVSKGLAKEAAMRGGADYDDVRGAMGSRKNRLTAALARGYGPTSEDKQEKASFAKLSKTLRNENDFPATARPARVLEQHKEENIQVRNKQPRSSLKVKRRQLAEPDIIPHFKGLAFVHEADSAWLGLDKRGAQLVLGLPKDEGRFISKEETYPRSNKPVYFNSNEFLGRQIISDEAVRAGYSGEGIVKDPSVAYKGVAVLLKQDTNKMHTSTEDRLLNLLVRSGPARLAVKNWLDSRRAVHSVSDLHWTCPSKEWLFACLVDGMAALPAETTELSELRAYFANREDAPGKAFAITEDGENAPTITPDFTGSLDRFFLHSTIGDEAPEVPKHGDVEAQELLATFVWVSTAHHAQLIRAELDKTISSLEKLPPAQNATDSSFDSTSPTNNTLALQSQLETKSTQLAQNLLEVVRSMHSLADSAARVRNRVLQDNSGAFGVRRLSKTAQKEFEQAMDDFVLNFSPPETSPEMGVLMSAGDDDADDDEPYEDVLERLENDWGHVLNDDESEPEPPILPPILNDELLLDDDAEETVEEWTARFEDEWGNWIDMPDE